MRKFFFAKKKTKKKKKKKNRYAQFDRSTKGVRMSGPLSPEGSASLFARYTQRWFTPLLQLGAREVLTAPRIWRLDEARAPDVPAVAALLSTRSLASALARYFRGEWLVSAAWRGGQLACQASTPFVVRSFVSFLSPSSPSSPIWQGLLLALLLGGIPMLEMLFAERAIWANAWTSTRLRSCLVLLVNRKILALRRLATAAGPDVGALVSVDVDRISESAENLHFLWRTPVNVVISMTVLAVMLGPLPALAGFGTLLLVVVAAVLCNRKFSSDKRKVAQQTDGRVAATKQLVRNVENVKSVALEGFFQAEIEGWRVGEVRYLRAYRALYAIFKALTLVNSPLILFASLAVYLLQGKVLSPGIVFSSLVVVNQLQMPFQQAVDVAVSLVEARVSLERMHQFLAQPADVRRFAAPSEPETVLLMRQASLSWKMPRRGRDNVVPADHIRLLESEDDEDDDDDDDNLVLESVDLEIRAGQLVWLAGRIGSGKSSMLQAVLGELYLISGVCEVSPSALFCGQNKDAALVTDSITENICWGSPFDHAVFSRVVAGCCLDADFSVLVDGPATVVGESGVTLSGGQRARICLARACYRALSEPDKPHLLLLDDPLSAVDGQTAHSLLAFLRSLPSNVAILISSHHSHLIAPHEMVVLLDRGRISDQGPLEDVRRRADSTLGGLFVDHQEIAVAPTSKTQVLATSFTASSSSSGGVAKRLHRDEDSARERGHVSWRVYWAFFGSAPWKWLGVALVFAVHFGVMLKLQLYVASISTGDGSLGTYSLISLVSSVLMVSKMVMLFVLTISCASHLHSLLLATITRLSKAAADTTPSGVFITCATAEMDAIDNRMSAALDVVLRQTLGLVLLMILGSISTYGVFVLVVGGIAAATIALGRWFGRSSIELARSTSICKAPVMSRIVEEEHALASIRSFGQEQRWEKQVFDRLWTLASCQLMQVAANRWLNQRLSLLGGLGVWILSFLGVSGLFSASPAYVALGVASSLDLRQIFNMTIQSLVIVENGMQACERIRQLGRTLDLEDMEAGLPMQQVAGHIQFENVCVTYRPGLPQVVSGVSFQVKPGEKVAICGRTGSGKSTLTRVLLRLVPFSGRVTVDGQDVCEVQLASLRSMLPTITQASLVFSGSLRDTIDPYGSLSDEQISRCMQHVGLEVALSVPAVSLSAGQLQLASFCRGLAKVLFGGARILLLDEASSSIDSVSERLVSSLLAAPALREVTVVVIAHRHVSIRACNRVLVMDAGRIVESGEPDELDRPGTVFYDLIHASK